MDNNISLSKLARSALSLILKYTVDENSNLIGQKFNEILNVGNPMVNSTLLFIIVSSFISIFF